MEERQSRKQSKPLGNSNVIQDNTTNTQAPAASCPPEKEAARQHDVYPHTSITSMAKDPAPPEDQYAVAPSQELKGNHKNKGSGKEHPDLWALAFVSANLSEKQKKALGISQDSDNIRSPSRLVTDVVKLTKERFAEYEASGWHVKPGKKDIDVGKEAKKILCSVLHFKDLIDAGLKFDPTGYGASAWAIISFSLQVSPNPSFTGYIVLNRTEACTE
jgi:hypothetical protein